MKLIAAAAIAQEKLPCAQAIVDCKGSIIINGQLYTCRYPHGRVALVEALGQSCNIFFAKAAKELNSDCFFHYLDKFGLRQSIKSYESASNSSADLILGLSQEYNLNAIDILQLVSQIATKGHLPSLHDDKYVIKPPLSPSPPFLSAHSWNVLQTGMHIACQRGTAKRLDPTNKLHLAVKTGTTVHGKRFQSWLAGYFPFEAPHYVFCLRASEGTSYDRAVPLARKYLFEKNWT
jgi:cell division protein FtsI/penicillin-binding protein 2